MYEEKHNFFSIFHYYAFGFFDKETTSTMSTKIPRYSVRPSLNEIGIAFILPSKKASIQEKAEMPPAAIAILRILSGSSPGCSTPDLNAILVMRGVMKTFKKTPLMVRTHTETTLTKNFDE